MILILGIATCSTVQRRSVQVRPTDNKPRRGGRKKNWYLPRGRNVYYVNRNVNMGGAVYFSMLPHV